MIRLTSFLLVWFQCVCPLMPSCNTYHLTWVSLTLGVGYLHGCSRKAQPLLLTLDEGYLLTTTIPDLQCRIAPLGPPVPAQPRLLRLLLPAASPGLGLRVAPQGHCPWLPARGGFSRLPLTSDVGSLLPAATSFGCWVAPPGRCPDLGRGVSPPSCRPWPRAQGGSSGSLPLASGAR